MFWCFRGLKKQDFRAQKTLQNTWFGLRKSRFRLVWLHFGSKKHGQTERFSECSAQNPVFYSVFLLFFRIFVILGPRGRPGGPRSRPGGPRSRPGAAQEPHRRPQEPPRSRPEAAQEAPGDAQEAPGAPQEPPRTPQEPPRRPRGAPRRTPGARRKPLGDPRRPPIRPQRPQAPEPTSLLAYSPTSPLAY